MRERGADTPLLPILFAPPSIYFPRATFRATVTPLPVRLRLNVARARVEQGACVCLVT
jgi:hypothetical protein